MTGEMTLSGTVLPVGGTVNTAAYTLLLTALSPSLRKLRSARAMWDAVYYT